MSPPDVSAEYPVVKRKLKTESLTAGVPAMHGRVCSSMPTSAT